MAKKISRDAGEFGGRWIETRFNNVFDIPVFGKELKPPAHFRVETPFYSYNGTWASFNLAAFNRAGDGYFKKKKHDRSRYWRLSTEWLILRHQMPAGTPAPPQLIQRPPLSIADFWTPPPPLDHAPLQLNDWWTPKRRRLYRERWAETLGQFYRERADRAAETRDYNRRNDRLKEYALRAFYKARAQRSADTRIFRRQSAAAQRVKIEFDRAIISLVNS